MKFLQARRTAISVKEIHFSFSLEVVKYGVPVVARWVTNLTRNHEVSSLIPGLAQWLRIQRCCELWCRLQMQFGSPVAVALE